MMTNKNGIFSYLPNAHLPAIFIFAFLLFYFGGAPVFHDEDVPWHIATGDLIRETGNVPDKDPWSFTQNGKPWYVVSWGWDLLISSITGIAGLKGLFLFGCTFKAVIITLLCHFIRKRGGSSVDPINIAILVASLGLLHVSGARPHCFTFMMLIIAHHIFHSSRDNSSIRKLLWLPLVTFIWANFHGGFIALAFLFMAYGLEAIYYKKFLWIRNMIITGLLCVISVFFTPLGTDIIPLVFSINSLVTPYISEWKPLTFGIYWGFDAMLAIFFVSMNLADKNTPFADKILVVVLVAFGVASARLLPILGILGAPYLASNLEKMMPHKRNYDLSIRKLRIAFLSGAVVIYLICLLFPLRYYLTQRDYITEKDHVPIAELEYLRNNLAGKHILNEYNFGGYMTYYNRNYNQVFVDGRASSIYAEEFLKDFIDIVEGRNVDSLIQKYQIDGLFIPNTGSAYKIPDLHDKSKWQLVFKGPVASIYLLLK